MNASLESAEFPPDEYIADPIRLSLAASIDDEKTAFLDPNKVDRHHIFEARTIDVWQGPQGPRLLDRTYELSRRLPDRLFDAWHPEAAQGERLVVRLLVTRPVPAGNGVSWIDDLGRPDHRQINYLPFIPQSIQDLIQQYDLPREWPWLRLNSREVGNFYRKTEWDFSSRPPRAIRMGIVVHFPFVLMPAKREDFQASRKNPAKAAGRRSKNANYNPWRDDPFIWSLAMSHSLRDGKTRGILDGLTDYAFGDLSQRMVRSHGQYYMHPLHVPCVLLNIFFDHAAWEVNRLATDVTQFEVLSRDAMISSLDKYDAITTELQFVKRNLQFQQNMAGFLLETIKFLDKKVFARQISDDISPYVTYVYETNPHVEEKLENTLHLVENNLQTCEYLKARTSDALDYIKGAIGLRDNESNREDADSNKVMSFLQMAFLPATGVAAVLSIGAFDWSQDPPSVTRSFWIFWLFALILTVLVLAIYFGSAAYKHMKIKQEEAQAKEKEEREDEEWYREPDDPRDRKRGRRRRGKDDSSGKNDKPQATLA